MKTGIIPYIKIQNDYWICLMIPSDPSYGGDKPQIAKGNPEMGLTSLENALKEGHEELGLRKDNIKKIELISQNKMIVFACEVKNQMDFDQPHYETGEIVWMNLDDIEKARPDQKKYIERLKWMLKINK